MLTLDYRDEAGRGTGATCARSACGSGARCGRWSPGASCATISAPSASTASPRSLIAGRTFKPERGKQLADFYRRAEMNETTGGPVSAAFPRPGASGSRL